jgi:predicted Zn-dependent peptidase
MMFRLATTILMLTVLVANVAAQGVTLPEFKRVELDNGTVLLLNEKRDVPLIGLQAIIRGGAVTDPAGLNGLSSLLTSVMEKGAGDRDALQFAEAVASVGGALSASGGLETLNVSADFMSRDADLMIELVADLLQRPTLAEEELDKLRQRRINFIRAAKDGNLNALMPIYGNAFLFGDHPYGNPVSGSETSLAEITHADLLKYYEEYVGGDRLVISVSGDFDTEVMEQKLAEAFGDWRAATGSLPEIEALAPEHGRRVLLIDKPGATQTYFRIANIGVSTHYPERAALNLANTLFGGRFTSMLNTALRVESGLTYGARSALMRPSQPGSVAIASFTRTDATTEAIDMALGVLGQLRDGAVTEESLQSGKNYILGQYPTGFETARQLAGVLAQLESNDLGIDYVNDYGAAIAAADLVSIAAVIEEVYPASDNLVFVVLGDAELIREQVASYGPVTELAISEPRFRP